MVKRRRTELPGEGESSEPRGSGARQGEPQHLPEQLLRYPDKSTCQQQGRGGQPNPVSTKPLRLPLRPGRGSIGTPILVKANHFLADLSYKDLHQYDVSISPEVSSRGVNRAVIKQLVKVYGKSHLGERLPAYDGRKNLYTAGPLPFVRNEFKIVLTDENDRSGSARTERGFKVHIKLASRVDLHHLEIFLKGNRADAPQGALQVLDTVMRELPTARYYPVGRSFYYPERRRRLGEGLESWGGFVQSMRPVQMGLSLNVDLSSTVLFEPLYVIEFASQLLNRDVSFRTLSDADCAKIQNALKGVIVEVSHSAMIRRKYRIAGLTSQPTKELKFAENGTGIMKVVVEYFRETYNVKLKHTQLPCLQVGTQQKPRYLPMEVCKIVRQRYTKRLNERQITEFFKLTCLRPRERESGIRQIAQDNVYADNSYAKEFGIRISDKLAPVEARILPPPWLKYHETGRETRCLPQVGQWSMVNKKLVDGGIVNNWLCINFAHNVGDNLASRFCYELTEMCRESGMHFSRNPVLPVTSACTGQVERVLKRSYLEVQKLKKELDLLIVILPDKNGSLYGDLKRICETDLGIVSQCCLKKNVFRSDKQYLASVALKINVKVGGRNTVLVDTLLRRIPLVTDCPTIIFGADVTHHRGEYSSPSFAAVVASQDWPEITKYVSLVSAQSHGEELIQDLYKSGQDLDRGTESGGMIKELLVSFYRSTGHKPQRIIFYRDGVGEGQFSHSLLYELDAVRKACASLEANYQPPVTYVVVQKRHHTRLFVNNHDDHNSVDRSGNILPGTVVDSQICHPTEFDFYLCSHASIKGTSRPTHYHVLWDENKFTADGLQTLTYNLCYTYARCTKSVSIVPPVYYAHLAASRARYYMEPETFDSESSTSDDAIDSEVEDEPFPF